MGRRGAWRSGAVAACLLAPSAAYDLRFDASLSRIDSFLTTLTSTPVALYVAAVLFVALACPLWLVRMMRFKRQINGPWDEAKPRAEALAARRRRAAVRRDGHGVGF